MPRYIDEELAEKAMTNAYEKDVEMYGVPIPECFPDGEAIRILRRVPTADVAPVRHGHWLLEREPNGKPYCFHCSACDNDFHHIGIKTGYDYCPLCGARMDEEATDGNP